MVLWHEAATLAWIAKADWRTVQWSLQPMYTTNIRCRICCTDRNGGFMRIACQPESADSQQGAEGEGLLNQRTRKARGVGDEIQRAKNRNKSSIRARVEHIFAVIKRLWGFTKVRYRGLVKNTCQRSKRPASILYQSPVAHLGKSP